jgi:hypothetical protein
MCLYHSLSIDDKALISAAIQVSRLSVRQFARDVLVREPRTVWRWLAGENALPAAVHHKCEAIINPTVNDSCIRLRMFFARLFLQLSGAFASQRS